MMANEQFATSVIHLANGLRDDPSKFDRLWKDNQVWLDRYAYPRPEYHRAEQRRIGIGYRDKGNLPPATRGAGEADSSFYRDLQDVLEGYTNTFSFGGWIGALILSEELGLVEEGSQEERELLSLLPKE
jgi:hypothetical protein